MPRYLLIDDFRDPARFGAVQVARTSDEAISALNKGGWDRVYFDNDLGTGQKEGWQIVSHMMHRIPQDKWPQEVAVVSSNPPARANIESKFEAMGYERTGKEDYGQVIWEWPVKVNVKDISDTKEIFSSAKKVASMYLAQDNNISNPGQTPQDKLYFEALERKDMVGAQRMVDEAAKRAGYNEIAYHGSPSEDITEFSEQNTSYGYFFTPDESTAGFYKGSDTSGKVYRVALSMHKTLDITDDVDRHKFFVDHMSSGKKIRMQRDKYGEYTEVSQDEVLKFISEQYFKNDDVKKVLDASGKIFGEEEGDPATTASHVRDSLEWSAKVLDEDDLFKLFPSLKALVDEEFPEVDEDVNSMEQAYGSQEFYMNYQDDVLQSAENEGYDSVIMDDPSSVGQPLSYVVFDSNQIKSAEAITHADDKSIIPLSQRFRKAEDDIRYASQSGHPQKRSFVSSSNKSYDNFWHGSPSGELKGSSSGIHIGTYQAAKEALGARIGYRADGKDWDGSQAYGDTLLAGTKTLKSRGLYPTGFNAGVERKGIEGDFVVTDYPDIIPKYSGGEPISKQSKPNLFKVKIVGPMSNTPATAYDDFKANGYMKASIKRGNAKNGFFYNNVSEDAGSISAVVPSKGHLDIVNNKATSTVVLSFLKNAKVLNKEEFMWWFGNSKVVDKDGNPLVAYHGTKRPDRIGAKFNKARATSGPMAFFTDNPEIASNYATNKRDTSVDIPEDYAQWFGYRPKGSRSTVNIDRAWYFLSPEEKANLSKNLPHVTDQDKDGNDIEGYRLGGPDEYGVGDKEHWEYTINSMKGNVLKAAKDIWLDSSQLFNVEEDFLKILTIAGMDPKKVVYQSPWLEYPGVMPTYLRIVNPLDTSKIPSNVISALEKAANRVRKNPVQGRDPWDKASKGPQEWIEYLHQNIQEGSTLAWTSIPDWVTKTLQSLGYDGIKDTGGKHSGTPHTVWIPFDEYQVKSAIGNVGTYDPSKKDIRYAFDEYLLKENQIGSVGEHPSTFDIAGKQPSTAKIAAMYLAFEQGSSCPLTFIGQDDSGFKYFFLDVRKDKFVHFTTKNRATEILKSGKLLLDAPHEKVGAYGVFAVSLTYGEIIPGVALSHVMRWAKEEGSEVVAIEFKTDTVPKKVGVSEEVSWGEQDVKLIDPKITHVIAAIQKIGASPCSLNDRSVVVYDKSLLKNTKLVEEQMARRAEVIKSASSLKPPESVASQAAKGLEYRRRAQGKGGLSTQQAKSEGIGSGVQRAVNLKNRDELSPSTVKRMKAFFDRHQKNKSIDPKHKDEPWKDRGYVAWLLWGGDPGYTWSKKMIERMGDDKELSKTSSRVVYAYLHNTIPYTIPHTLDSTNYPIYKDPNPYDISEILKESSGSVVRAGVQQDGGTYAWDGAVPHESVSRFLRTSWAVNVNYYPQTKIINLYAGHPIKVEDYVDVLKSIFPDFTQIKSAYGDFEVKKESGKNVLEPIKYRVDEFMYDGIDVIKPIYRKMASSVVLRYLSAAKSSISLP